ncbi:tetratricopeptide repeat protein [Candidatus Micrarchaeota archaeon]|nr:tetratricopeptide repeat protein [Candidatus Micrarchaeota archaeon]
MAEDDKGKKKTPFKKDDRKAAGASKKAVDAYDEEELGEEEVGVKGADSGVVGKSSSSSSRKSKGIDSFVRGNAGSKSNAGDERGEGGAGDESGEGADGEPGEFDDDLDDFGGDSSPTDARTYYHRGNAFYEKNDFDKAIENYNMAIVLNPNFSEAYFNRGLCYYNKKEFEKSISDYNRSAELDPRNAVIFNNRGDAFYRKQDFEKAIVDYDKAVSLNPRYLKAYYNRGLAYACQQDYERAVEDFNKVIELNPNFAEAYHIRGLAFDYMGNYEKAVADYDKAIELNPNFTEAINHRELAKGKWERGEVPTDAGGAAGGGAMGATTGGPEGGGTVNVKKLLQHPTMTFVEVAGMEKTKEEIRDAIVYPLRDPELARKYGKFGGGGIMLYGPPGCGKTFIVKGAAGEAKSAFINAKISDVMDMYVGNTEKNLHAIFEGGRKNSPCIVFFDEVEALGGRRDQMGQQPYQKMAVNQLLYEMDGVEARNENMLILAATNAPWDVDPALRRSGRFSKLIFIPEPDIRSRLQIFKFHSKNRPLAGNIDWVRLGFATMGYSSSDIKIISEEAATIPWKEAYLAQEQGKSIKQRDIQMRDYLKVIRKRRSSLGPWYESAKKEIGQQEEKTVVDGKEHIKITDSKMGVGEKEQFKELLNLIKKNNKWYWKMWKWVVRRFALYVMAFVPAPISSAIFKIVYKV